MAAGNTLKEDSIIGDALQIVVTAEGAECFVHPHGERPQRHADLELVTVEYQPWMNVYQHSHFPELSPPAVSRKPPFVIGPSQHQAGLEPCSRYILSLSFMMAIHMPVESIRQSQVLRGFIAMRRLHDCGTAAGLFAPERNREHLNPARVPSLRKIADFEPASGLNPQSAWTISLRLRR